MTSKEVFQEILYKVSTKKGAPMGRSDKGKKPENKRVFSRRVHIDSYGYDKGGAYWGIGGPLYVEYTADMSYIKFFRK